MGCTCVRSHLVGVQMIFRGVMEDQPFGRAPCPKVTEVDAVLASGGIPKSKVLRIKGAICDDQLMTQWLKVKTIR